MDLHINLGEEEADLDLSASMQVPEYYAEIRNKAISEDLQRTPQWRIDRHGCLTGSEGTEFMACNAKGGKLSWSEPEKVFEFSKGIIKYIYRHAKERITGRYIETGTTKDMLYGTVIEPLIARRAQEQFLNTLNLTLIEVGFKKFKNIPTAGASSDRVVLNAKQKNHATAEFKACTNWNTHYQRTYEFTDESSKDFWQMLIQQVAWEVEKAYYFVASPPQNIMKYITAEDPMELYEYWCNETELTMEIIEISPLHAKALIQRITILENVIMKYIATGSKIADILEEEINFHKKLFLANLAAVSDEIEEAEEITEEEEITSEIEEEEVSEDQTEIDFSNEFF